MAPFTASRDGRKPRPSVRRTSADDAPVIARMLHDFNTEFSEPTPGTAILTCRVLAFIRSGAMTYLMGGVGPDGFAQVSFRPSVWADEPVGYLEELYVIPDRRGEGIGRALMTAVLELARERRAAGMEVVTGRGEGPGAVLRAELLRRDSQLPSGFT